jgi:hypothetical protein
MKKEGGNRKEREKLLSVQKKNGQYIEEAEKNLKEYSDQE